MIPRKINLAGSQQGVALLTVLFILVLLSTLAVYTAEDENIAIRRAENQRDMAQAYRWHSPVSNG
jgi:type II secretory pathway component PulK